MKRKKVWWVWLELSLQALKKVSGVVDELGVV